MADAPAAAPKDQSLELLKLRGEVGRLRQENTQVKTPITHDLVEARYKHAQELARSGDSAAALKEFLWCFERRDAKGDGIWRRQEQFSSE